MRCSQSTPSLTTLLLTTALLLTGCAHTAAPAPTVPTSYNFSLLTSFTGASGASPGLGPYYGNLVQGSDGNFYGTTQFSGLNNAGTAFKITPNGTFTLLHSFSTAVTDGSYPMGNLIQGSDGSFYGTTYAAGAIGYGTVFKITPAGTFTLLHSFTRGATDAANPQTALVQGSDGNFYGTTAAGGANGDGSVFEITPSGTFTLLHFFAGTDGASPHSSLIQGSDGSFYGTTDSGGANAGGTVFKITPSGTFTLLHSFSSATTDGEYPFAALVQGSDGNFYGTTSSGGVYAVGTFFKITPGGTFTLMHSFSGAVTDGADPNGGLTQGSDGNFYGTTIIGGANGVGTVFEITPSGTFTLLLHSFSGATTDGNSPYSGLIQGSDGNFYGSTHSGGASGDGTLFKLAVTPALSGPVTLAVPKTVTHATSFTLNYTVANAFSTTGVTATGNTTLQSCFATNTAGDTTGWTGSKTGSTTATNATLTAPATPGTYTYTLTCGGMETGTTSLVVQ